MYSGLTGISNDGLGPSINILIYLGIDERHMSSINLFIYFG
jgi:hypothetical protein